MTITAEVPQTVSISLCSVFGTVVDNLGDVALAEDDNVFNFNVAQPRGVYVVKVTGKSCTRSKAVTLK